MIFHHIWITPVPAEIHLWNMSQEYSGWTLPEGAYFNYTEELNQLPKME